MFWTVVFALIFVFFLLPILVGIIKFIFEILFSPNNRTAIESGYKIGQTVYNKRTKVTGEIIRTSGNELTVKSEKGVHQFLVRDSKILRGK